MKSGWEIKTVSEVAQHSLGKMLDKAKNRGVLRPYLRNLNVRWFEFDLSDLLEMKFLPAETAKFTAVRGDVLVCEGGYPGRAAIWEDADPIHFQKAIHRVRFHEPDRNKWFVFYLHYLDVTGQLKAYFSGTGIQHFTGQALARLSLPLPPLSEQRRIVAILDEAFKGIATAKADAERNLRNARDVFESHRDTTFLELQWREHCQHLEDLVEEIATGPFGSLLHKSDYEEGGIPLVNPINIEEEAIVADERKAVSPATAKRLARYRLKAGDIAVGRRGDIGRCAVVAPEQAGWLCGTGCFVVRTGKAISPDFLAHLLRSSPYRKQLVAKAGRATMPSISNKDLARLLVPAIEPNRQRQALDGFAELSDHCTELAEGIVRKLAALDELKASLLHQAFTGQL